MRRFVNLVDEKGDYLVLDMKKPDSPVLVCKCVGWKAPLQADYVIEALECYHSSLMEKLNVPNTGITIYSTNG